MFLVVVFVVLAVFVRGFGLSAQKDVLPTFRRVFAMFHNKFFPIPVLLFVCLDAWMKLLLLLLLLLLLVVVDV